MRNLLFKLALVLLVAASFTSFSQPYSFVKSHDTGARYVKLTSSDDTLFAISESNYIDLYNLNEFEQKKPRKRLEFDRVVTDAVYSEGHLVVSFEDYIVVYQLDDNDKPNEKKRINVGQLYPRKVFASSGDYIAVQLHTKVELLKWSDKDLLPLTHLVAPTSHFATATSIDNNTLVVEWKHESNNELTVDRYNLTSGELHKTKFQAQYSSILISTNELLANSPENTMSWYHFTNNEWQLIAKKEYASIYNLTPRFKHNNHIYFLKYTDALSIYRLENNEITFSDVSFKPDQYCNSVSKHIERIYCLMDDRISIIEFENQTPKITRDLALFTPGSKVLTSNDSQLFQLSDHELRSTELTDPDLYNSTAKLKLKLTLDMLDVFRDQILLNNGTSFLNLKNQGSFFTETERLTDYQLDWNSYFKNWFASNTLIATSSSLRRFQFYKTNTEQFLFTPPVFLLWDKIQLPGAEQINSVQEVHYHNNWLVLKINTNKNNALMYAVPLNPTTYQPIAQPQLLTDGSGKPLWSGRIYSEGSLLVLHNTVGGNKLIILEIGDTQIKHKTSYDLTQVKGCSGYYSEFKSNLFVVTSVVSPQNVSEYCVFELKNQEFRFIQKMSPSGYNWNQSAVTFTQFGSTLAAAIRGDGRTTFYQKNYAPQSQLVLTEIAEDSKDQLVVQSIDAENDSIQLQLLEQPEHGEISVTDHQLFYTPDADFSGVDQWLLRSSDVHGNFTETRHQLTVTPVNDAPKLQAPAHFNLKEDSQLTVQLAATDAEQQQISFQLLDDPQFGTATVSATGLLNYNTAENLFGQDQLELQLTDSEGASRVETISLQIEPVNDLPQLQQLSLNGVEDQVLVAALPVMDPDSAVASITLVEAPLNGSATFSGTTLTYQPKPDFNGTEQLKLRLNDSAGGSTETSLSLEIEAVNDAPLYHGTRHYQLDEDNLLKVTLEAQDKENQSVQFKLLSPATLGVAQLSPAGELSYSPHSNLSGEEKLQIQLTDSEQASTHLELSISIRAVNDLPQLRQFSFSVAEDAELSVTLEVTDADSTPGSIELIQNASHGQATLTGQRLQYKATANYHGQDKIRLRLNDSAGGYAEVDLLLQVTAVNDSPVLAAQSLTMNTGTSRSLQLAATDAENDTLSYTLQSTANLGTATLSSTGLLSYTATAAGTENLTVEVKDPSGAAVQANISIVITTPPAPPAESSSGGGLGWPAFVLLLLCYSRRRSARY